jgi:hypothetical protein
MKVYEGSGDNAPCIRELCTLIRANANSSKISLYALGMRPRAVPDVGTCQELNPGSCQSFSAISQSCEKRLVAS